MNIDKEGNVTNLILNPQDINVNGNKKPTQSLTSIKKFKSVSALRSKFSSRKSVFDQAKEEILNDLDKKTTADKSLIALEENADATI